MAAVSVFLWVLAFSLLLAGMYLMAGSLWKWVQLEHNDSYNNTYNKFDKSVIENSHLRLKSLAVVCTIFSISFFVFGWANFCWYLLKQ